MILFSMPAWGRLRAPSALIVFALCCGHLLCATAAHAATIYVDRNLPSNCATGQYSVASRTCGGADGSGFTSFASAINAMQPGDTVDIRGGTYTVPLTVSKS